MSYRPNHKDVAHYLSSDPHLRTALAAKSAEAVAFAREQSPVRSGEYARSWYTEATHVIVAGTKRMAVKIGNSAGYAAAIEYGYKGRAKREGSRRPQHIFGRMVAFLRSGR